MRKLFWKLVSNRYLLEAYTDYMTMLNLDLCCDYDHEKEVQRYIDKYITPEMERRGL